MFSGGAIDDRRPAFMQAAARKWCPSLRTNKLTADPRSCWVDHTYGSSADTAPQRNSARSSARVFNVQDQSRRIALFPGLQADFSRVNKGLLYPRRMERAMSDICLMSYLKREREEREKRANSSNVVLYLLMIKIEKCEPSPKCAHDLFYYRWKKNMTLYATF